MKNVLKFAIIALLLICIVAIPLCGVSFYDSPSIFKENAIFFDNQFGGGTRIFLSFEAEDEGDITDEDYTTAAKILKERLLAIGYSKINTEAKDKQISVEIPQKTYIESIIQEVSSIGEWMFVGSDMSTSLCDASMVEDAYVTANASGGYGITLKFTEEGAKKFQSKTASYAVSTSSIYLMIDGQFTAMASVSSSELRETFTFGAYEYQSAAMVASIIKNGALPAEVEIEKTESIAPAIRGNGVVAIGAAVAVIILLCIALLLICGKLSGVFAAAAIVADVAILATALANGAFVLNIASLVTMLILLILATAFLIYVAAPLAKSGKMGKSLLASPNNKHLSKANVKAIWIHACLFAISLLGWMFVKGSILFIFRIGLLFACASFATYFVFFAFGVYTAGKMQEEKK